LCLGRRFALRAKVAEPAEGAQQRFDQPLGEARRRLHASPNVESAHLHEILVYPPRWIQST
jgi:hypothetical protein